MFNQDKGELKKIIDSDCEIKVVILLKEVLNSKAVEEFYRINYMQGAFSSEEYAKFQNDILSANTDLIAKESIEYENDGIVRIEFRANHIFSIRIMNCND